MFAMNSGLHLLSPGWALSHTYSPFPLRSDLLLPDDCAEVQRVARARLANAVRLKACRRDDYDISKRLAYLTPSSSETRQAEERPPSLAQDPLGLSEVQEGSLLSRPFAWQC